MSALDVFKAFDRVNHFSVTKCLLERGFPSQLVNVFLIWFRNMRACVKWGCNNFVYFDIKSGCPEGSILGLKLFNLVVNELLKRLEEVHFGCRVGSCFAGAFRFE